MSLATPTKNLFSNIMANSKHPTPEVGMGATELLYTDRHACTIVDVVNAKTIIVQRDNAIRTDTNGMSDSQQYEYVRDTMGRLDTVTLRNNGRWVKKGENLHNGTSYGIGYRKEYRDYSF